MGSLCNEDAAESYAGRSRTSILISAALNPNGTPYKAYLKAVTFPNNGIICDQKIEE